MSKDPDYEVKTSRAGAKHAILVGAAWKTEDDRIDVRLAPGVSVGTPDGVILTLCPTELRELPQAAPRRLDASGEEPPPDDDFGDDVPF